MGRGDLPARVQVRTNGPRGFGRKCGWIHAATGTHSAISRRASPTRTRRAPGRDLVRYATQEHLAKCNRTDAAFSLGYAQKNALNRRATQTRLCARFRHARHRPRRRGGDCRLVSGSKRAEALPLLRLQDRGISNALPGPRWCYMHRQVAWLHRHVAHARPRARCAPFAAKPTHAPGPPPPPHLVQEPQWPRACPPAGLLHVVCHRGVWHRLLRRAGDARRGEWGVGCVCVAPTTATSRRCATR
jgi:hypothetical protein